MGKKTIGEYLFDIFNYAVLIILSFVCIYPFLHVFFASISDPGRLMAHTGPILAPLGFTLKGYKLVFENPNILLGYKNTLIYLVAGTALSILMTSMGAYVLSRKGVLFGRLMMFLITFTMYFGGGLIPWYILMKGLGLVNNIWSMILPTAIVTYNLIVMRTSFLTIPDSVEESARIDGANDFTILFRIVLPLSKAVVAVMVLFYAVGQWNSWFNALLFLKDRDLFPLQLILREILITNDQSSMTSTMTMVSGSERQMYKSLIQYCTIIVATLPILFAYPFLQKYFTKGVMIGSLKE
jgi:putative aldouronate transport system permease protein